MYSVCVLLWSPGNTLQCYNALLVSLFLIFPYLSCILRLIPSKQPPQLCLLCIFLGTCSLQTVFPYFVCVIFSLCQTVGNLILLLSVFTEHCVFKIHHVSVPLPTPSLLHLTTACPCAVHPSHLTRPLSQKVTHGGFRQTTLQ